MKSLKEPCGQSETATITNIQHFSLHDGPGIRTTVFFKGCNLRCTWCHNPETLEAAPQLGVDDSRCIGCGACEQACPNRLHRVAEAGHAFDRARCSGCGACVEACPTNALMLYGRAVPLEEIIRECGRDQAVFPDFGGITFSGGECLLQAEQVFSLASALKQRGIHICVDTALNVPWSVVEALLPVVDLFLADLKAGTEETHRRYTGASQQRIRENLQRLSDCANCWIRIPMVHGVNDTEQELVAMKTYISGLGAGLQRVQLLAYHALGGSKYRWLSMDVPQFEPPAQPAQEGIRQYLEAAGVPTEWN